MDFDDLLVNWKRLLLEHENIREYYAAKLTHILVDEYQDTNKLQAEIVDLLSNTNRNIVVGRRRRPVNLFIQGSGF